MSAMAAIAQEMSKRIPSMSQRLSDADIPQTPLSYLSRALWVSCAFGLFALALSWSILYLFGGHDPLTPAATGAFTTLLSLAYHLLLPMHLSRARATKIESNLVFCIHALNVELMSGASFARALANVGGAGYGETSRQFERILTDAQRKGLPQAIRDSIRRNPSKPYQRTMWQILSGIETGADIAKSLESIADDLVARQERQVVSYAASMERHLTIYVMGGIVIPALAVVVIQTVSSLGLSQESAGPHTFYSILAFSAIVQVAVLFAMKIKKPTLLGASHGHDEPPAKLMKRIKRRLEHAGVTDAPKDYLVPRTILTFIVCALLAWHLSPHLLRPAHQLFAFFALLSVFSWYFHLDHLASIRGEEAASHLPDALRVIASNMRSGMPAQKALCIAAKENTRALGQQLDVMALELAKNRPFIEAIRALKDSVRSGPLYMSASLMAHGASSGSGLSKSLYGIADILSARQNIREQARTRLGAFAATIMLLTVLCAPLLYACSTASAAMMGGFNTRLASSIPNDIMSQSFFTPGVPNVSDEFLKSFVMTNLLATSILGAAIIGETTKGRALSGLRQALLMAVSGQLSYLIMYSIIFSELAEAIA